MNLQASFSESEVAIVITTTEGIHIRLSAAHVLKNGPTVDSKPVEGFSRGIGLLLHGTELHESPTPFIGRVAEGRVQIEGQWFSKIPIPCTIQTPVKLEVTFANQSHLTLTATGLECRFEGEPNFHESLFC